MKVQYRNPIIRGEELAKYIEKKYSIKYWITLKLPVFLRKKEYEIEVVKKKIIKPFIKEIEKVTREEKIFILGTIEENYKGEGFHAHVIIAAWREAIKYVEK